MCTHTQSKATPLRTAPHEYPLASYTPQHAVHQRLLHQDTFSALPSKFMSACVILVLGMHVRPCLPIHKKATSHHPVCNPLTFCLVPQVHRVIAFHELVAHYGGLCVTAFSEHVTHVVIGVRGCCVCVCACTHCLTTSATTCQCQHCAQATDQREVQQYIRRLNKYMKPLLKSRSNSSSRALEQCVLDEDKCWLVKRSWLDECLKKVQLLLVL